MKGISLMRVEEMKKKKIKRETTGELKTNYKIDTVCLLSNLIGLCIVGCYWTFEIWLLIVTLTSQPRGGIVALLLAIFIPYSVIFVIIMVDNIKKMYRVWRNYEGILYL